MGNRAVITTPAREMGVYLHWNGGRDSVEPFLRYCEMSGFRSPARDPYGWARLVQVVANFFGGDGLSVGVAPYAGDDCENPGDNGIYVVEGWEIVGRVYPWEDFEEQDGYDLREFLRSIDGNQPEGMRLGAEFIDMWLDGEEVEPSALEVGDSVLVGRNVCEVAGFVDEDDRWAGGLPFVMAPCEWDPKGSREVIRRAVKCMKRR